MDFSREELEAEIWRLRSVEIDLESLQQDNRNLQALHSDQAGLVNELEEARFNMEKRYEDERERRKTAERDKDAAQKENDRYKRERDWALEKLQTYEDADYMYRNYDFKVTDQLPERNRKGWRKVR